MTMTTNPIDDDKLVQRALSTVARADVPAGLSDRAFAAAMTAERPSSPSSSSFGDWFVELLAISRVAAGAAGVVAAVLVVVAFTRPASTTSTSTASSDAVSDVAMTSADVGDEWIEAVLPLDVSSSRSLSRGSEP